VKTNFTQRLPFIKQLSKHYFFLYPLAFRLQDTGDADVVISSSSYAAKFVRVKTGGLHICYLHTPPRFLWGYDTELYRYYAKSFDKYLSPVYGALVPPMKAVLRNMDHEAAQKVDFFIANSKEVQKRIKKHYNRDSVVIYPPVNVERFQSQKSKLKNQNGNYFLVVSRLGGYKKVDIVVEAFNKLALPLKIVGDGPQYKFLKEAASNNIEFLGRRSDTEVSALLANCRALIFPTHEDFGIVPVEAMAAGKPVIAYRGGGALETVLEGVTGEFFDHQTTSDIIKVVKRFQPNMYNSMACQTQANKFSEEKFKREMRSFVEEAWRRKIDLQ
ncbi:MAG: hypothetical protein A2Z11_03325, partial [Candidatus Woykebacteria bacterium RBG_16_43_9]